MVETVRDRRRNRATCYLAMWSPSSGCAGGACESGMWLQPRLSVTEGAIVQHCLGVASVHGLSDSEGARRHNHASVSGSGKPKKNGEPKKKRWSKGQFERGGRNQGRRRSLRIQSKTIDMFLRLLSVPFSNFAASAMTLPTSRFSG